MESSPNLTSSSYSVVQAVAKAPRLKISSEIIVSYISQLVIFSEKKDKKEVKMQKWSKTSSNKENYSLHLSLSNCLKNVYLFMEIEDIFSMASQEISKTGKNSKNSSLIT